MQSKNAISIVHVMAVMHGMNNIYIRVCFLEQTLVHVEMQ